ncbi:MAG: sulfatase-like hydrolase/transferase, partial [Cyclobacteriaceae bacterium]|nr:sulfatase-like hydrolase/transferase [Cyclobacteriaceae bacterium]
IGSYGSEIKTPNLDRLAENGTRFSRFHNMAKCETTRSVMLTGLYNSKQPVKPLSYYLSRAGYRTIMTGKEHFQPWVPDSCYSKYSFDRSLTYPIINEFFVPPSGQFEKPFSLNGKPFDMAALDTGATPLYKTNVITDYALKFMKESVEEKKPFFLYVPYHTAHYPLQALPEDIAKYRGQYKKGWDQLRQERYNRMIKSGIIEENVALSPPEGNINKFRGHPKDNEEIRASIPLYRPWDSLSEEEQDDLDLEMSVFAAMVDRMDQNIGRIVGYLEETGQMDNTLIMYLSDNGSCPYDSNRDFDVPPGGPDSYRTLCAAWANLGNTPFRYFKQYGHAGGNNTQLIVHWPGVVPKGTISRAPGHVADILPTLLDIVNSREKEAPVIAPAYPLDGTSLLPVFKGGEREEPEYMVSGMPKFRMYSRGKWKIVKTNDGPWELYDTENDRAELHDLAPKQPEKVAELAHAYEEWQSLRN